MWFLAASVLLHVPAAALIGAWMMEGAQPPAGQVIEVTLEQPLPARAGSSPEAEAVPPARIARGASRAKGEAGPEPVEPGPPAPAIETPPVPEQALPPGPWLFKLSHDVMSRSVDLPVPAGPAGIEAMLDGYDEDHDAVQAVKQGNVDPDLFEMRSLVEDAWSPSFDEIDESPLSGAPGKLLGDWMQSAKLYGKTGSPVSGPADPEPEWKPDAGVIDVKDQMEKSGAFTERVALGVTILFDGEGGWQIGGIEPSGHPRFDEAALAAIEKSLGSKGAKMPARKQKTVWAMEADFSVAPPLPVAGFGFDLALGYFEPTYPLKKKVKHRMRLVAVYLPAPGGDG